MTAGRPALCALFVLKEESPHGEQWALCTCGHARGATEHWLFGVRGSFGLQTTEALPTLWLWPRLPHSQKPDAFYDLVELASPGPYLDMFARRQRLGWDTWGDEALEHVSLGSVES